MEFGPLLVREAMLVLSATSKVLLILPFRLLGPDTDNGSEFLNEVLFAYCETNEIKFTRSRPYRKNDQAWVEQKNGAVVRRLVGYRRLEGLAAVEALSRLYASSRLFVNFFQPSFKLKEKTRTGSRVTKQYHAPETPCARLLGSDVVSEGTKEQLRAAAATLDPLRLLDEIRTMQHHITNLALGQVHQVVPQRDADLETFLRGLATAWREGEIRPTHRSVAKASRHWRTRKDPFEAVWPTILGWLEAEPDRTARGLLVRLQQAHEESFPDSQLRTLQRRVKQWRSTRARELVFGDQALAHAGEFHGGFATASVESTSTGSSPIVAPWSLDRGATSTKTPVA